MDKETKEILYQLSCELQALAQTIETYENTTAGMEKSMELYSIANLIRSIQWTKGN